MMKNKEKRIKDERYVRRAFSMSLVGILLTGLALALSFKVSAAGDNVTAPVEGPPAFVDINIQEACPDIKGLKKDTRSVSHFSHKAHIEALKKDGNGFVCAVCHHGAKTEGDILNAQKCKRIEKELAETGGPARLKDHFHNQCLKCHKQLKKEKKPTGPTSCKGCHSRKGA